MAEYLDKVLILYSPFWELVLPFRLAGVMFQLYVLEDCSYRFYLTPKLSASSLSYKDLFLDEATDKVGYDCKAFLNGLDRGCLHVL